MRLAQWIATAIYVCYITLATVSFSAAEMGHSETAVIGLSALISPWLAPLLVGAALAAQFSAAIADTLGSVGLGTRISRRRPEREFYVVIAAAGVALTWTVDVFAIIAWASRAFALYYALQSALAATLAWRSRRGSGRWRSLGFAGLALFGLLIVVGGRSAE